MRKPDPVETILARLMPPALSTAGQREIETMLEALAAAPAQAAPATAARVVWMRRVISSGIAAAAVAAALLFPLATPPAVDSWAETAPVDAGPAELVLVGESDRIESMTDEGLQENADGSAMRALRLSVVEENSLLDKETGIVMQVSEPREEILLMPVSAF